MKAIFKHELAGFFHSMTAYIFCAFVLIFVGIGAMLYNIQAAVANFEYVLQFVNIGLAIIVPVLTMRTMAEEKKQKTDQLLYALPLKTTDVVIGKFLATFVIFLIPMAIISIYPLIFSRFGDVYLPTSYGSIIAFIIMGAAMIAIGIFISSLTENQGIAAGIGIGLLLFNYYSVTLADYISTSALGSYITLVVVFILIGFLVKALTKNDNIAFAVALILIGIESLVFFLDQSVFESLVPNIVSKLSLFDRFTTIVNGVFDLTVIIFYVTVIVLFLFLTVQSLEKRRYN